MKQKLFIRIILPVLLASIPLVLGAAHHEHGGGEHTITKPDDLQWQAGPPSLPPGAEFVVMEGDPSQEGMFTMRIKVPADYRIPPHTHPRVERVTVIEGEVKIGTGREFNEQEMEVLPQGGFFVMPPGMEHFAAADEESIIQLTGTGPWEIRYINPADDPRRTTE